MRRRADCLTISFSALVLLGAGAWAFNYWVTQFLAGDWAMVGILATFSLLFGLVGRGLYFLIGSHFAWARLFQELAIGLGVWSVLLVVAGMVSYTPFAPIDAFLVKSDASLHLSVSAGMQWMQLHPWLKACLTFCYGTLELFLLFTLIVLIVYRRYTLLYEYYSLLVISACIGYAIYYFFPTTAPASIVQSPYFLERQYATGLKFNQLHQYQLQTTSEGGLIAFPSFHIIWTWLLVYAVRCWPMALIACSFYGMMVTFACVLLGWHYWVDILGSVAVLALTYSLERYFIYGKPYLFRRQY